VPDPFAGPSGEPVVRFGVPLLDEFLAGAVSAEYVLAAAYDLNVFFAVVDKAPGEVCPADVLGFITASAPAVSATAPWCRPFK
jgi:integrase/recombinase XerD